MTAITLLLASSAILAATLPTQADVEPPLGELLAEYFDADEPALDRLTAAIDERVSGDWRAIAAALPTLQLWSPMPERTGVFLADEAERGPIRIGFDLPEGYDPARAYPVILCLGGGSQPPPVVLRDARRRFGASAADAIFAAADPLIATDFNQPAPEADRTIDVVRALRRRLHTDDDRLFLAGFDNGADAAWPAAISHPDLFAGFVSLNGYARVPYPNELYRLLLPNIRHVPVIAAFRTVDQPQRMTRDARVWLHDRVIAEIAREEALPFTFHAYSAASDSDLFDLAGIATLLSKRRSPPGGRTTHHFRYPWQGSAGWLRATEFGGPVWTAEVISILPSGGVDDGAFITDVLRSHLASLAGRIDGQVIRIRTRKCREIQIRFTPDMVDLQRPVTVIVNGITRHSGPLKGSIKTLLTTARRDWAFHHPTPAILTIPIESNAD